VLFLSSRAWSLPVPLAPFSQSVTVFLSYLQTEWICFTFSIFHVKNTLFQVPVVFHLNTSSNFMIWFLASISLFSETFSLVVMPLPEENRSIICPFSGVFVAPHGLQITVILLRMVLRPSRFVSSLVFCSHCYCPQYPPPKIKSMNPNLSGLFAILQTARYSRSHPLLRSFSCLDCDFTNCFQSANTVAGQWYNK
jgi:hypothetical protein